MSDVVATLTAARELLSDPARWTKEALARKPDGKVVMEDNPSAVCWCSLGAVYKCGNSMIDVMAAVRVLGRLLNCSVSESRDVVSFNDAPTTTHADVLAAFDRAIVKAKELS